jgi:hypothetical protein
MEGQPQPIVFSLKKQRLTRTSRVEDLGEGITCRCHAAGLFFRYTQSVDRLVLASAPCETTQPDVHPGGTRNPFVCGSVSTRIQLWLGASSLVLLITTSTTTRAQAVYPSKTTPQIVLSAPQASMAVPQMTQAVGPPLAPTPPLAVAPPLIVAQAPLATPQSPLATPQCLGTPQASPQCEGTSPCACYYPQGYCPFPSGNCAFPRGNCRAPVGSCVGTQPWASGQHGSPQVSQ